MALDCNIYINVGTAVSEGFEVKSIMFCPKRVSISRIWRALDWIPAVFSLKEGGLGMNSPDLKVA